MLCKGRAISAQRLLAADRQDRWRGENPVSPMRFVKHPHSHPPSRAPNFSPSGIPTRFYSRKRKGPPRHFHECAKAGPLRSPKPTSWRSGCTRGGAGYSACEHQAIWTGSPGSAANFPHPSAGLHPATEIPRRGLVRFLKLPVETGLPASTDAAHCNDNDYSGAPPGSARSWLIWLDLPSSAGRGLGGGT